MDRRYKPISLSQQMQLRQQVIDELLAHQEWSLQESICHLKKGLRLTTADVAKLAGVSYRTVQDIELGNSSGTVKTMNRILGILGLRLSVTLDKHS